MTLVLDASVLIAHLDAHDAHHDRANALLASSGDMPLIASVVTMAEALVGPTRAGVGDRVTAALQRLGVAPVAVPADAARELARLRGTGLRLPGCIVVLTALRQAPAVLATFDRRMDQVARDHDITVITDAPGDDATTQP